MLAVLGPRAMLAVEEMMVQRVSLDHKEILVLVASLGQTVEEAYLGLQGQLEPREIL